MRITGLHLDAYGHFRDSSFEDLGAPVVCLSGPNEVGKSTLFSFVSAMLYGIYPVDPAANPYAPYDARHLQGRLRYSLDDGGSGEIARSLRSTPEGEWIKGDGLFRHPESIRNTTLPVVNHVSRRVFQNVYALSLHDLTEFDAATFEEIQDRLLGGLNAGHIRSARAVADEIAAEALKLWRPDQRGKPKTRLLIEEKRLLADELRDARDRADEVRRAGQRILTIESEQKALEREKQDLRDALETARARSGVSQRVVHFWSLRAAGAEADDLADIPEDPAGSLETYRIKTLEVDAELARLRSRERVLRSVADPDWPVDRLVASSSRVELCIERYDEASAAVQDSTLMRADRDEVSEQFARTVSNICGGARTESAHDHAVSVLAELDEIELEHRVRDVERVRENSSTVAARRGGLGRRAGFSIAIAGTCTAIAVVVFETSSTIPGYVFLLGAVVASVAFAHSFSQWRRLGVQLQALRENLDYAESRVADFLRDLPVRAELLREPGQDLVSGVGIACDLARNLVRMTVDDERQRLRLWRAADELRELCSEFVPDCGDLSSNQLIDEARRRLKVRVEEAPVLRAERIARKSELEQLSDDVHRLAEHASGLARLHGVLRTRLEEFGGGDLAAGVDRLVQARISRRAAVELEQELIAEGVDVNDPNHGVGMSEGEVDDEGTSSRLKRRLGEIEVVTAERREEEVALREELARIGVHRSVADVEGDLEAVESELADVRTRHDRLRLLEGVVRLADQRFRERHQPDVIARANRYLNLITDGKYLGVMLDETTRNLSIVSTGDTQARPLDSSVSQGTRDQVYLALRLALADHVDAEHELLPIFLDEVFVTWDKERRHRAYPILAELSRRRQIFLLTCHRWFEEEALMHLGAHVVHLERVAPRALV